MIEQPSVIVNSFNCDQCDKVCKNKSGLTVHKRVHKQIVNEQPSVIVKSILSK